MTHIDRFTDDLDPGPLQREKYTIPKGHLKRVQCDTG